VDAREQLAGLALACDEQGIILEVLRDELGVADRVAPGRSLTLVVDRGSFEKALNFLVELQTRGAAFNWQLNVPIAGQVSTLHFAGIRTGGQLVVLGAQTHDGVMRLYEGLMRIGNEQANALRVALKEQAESARDQAERDSALYDELTRLNNELAALQREMAKRNVDLERLNEQKNQFLGMAAHDLRNPLSIITAYSEFLIDEAADVLDQEHREFLSIIRNSSQFMLQLVEDLLDIAKIESGKLQLELQPVDLVALIERNVALNRVLAARKQIELDFVYDGNIPHVMLDASKAEQVLNNLINNAIKFSHPHTTVRVRACRQGEGTEDCVVIAVEDEGQGIPPEERERLFQPFVRTSVRGTAGEKSTGLGLAIVKKIVVGHGGEIWVESHVGQGTTFYVSLPICGQEVEG